MVRCVRRGGAAARHLLGVAVLCACAGAAEAAGRDFFDQATRSINHDKNVLAKLESHPLAHASGWNIRQDQGSNGGWSERATSAGPRLGGRAWQKKNEALEGELERMSDSVNVMFKDQGNKRRYQKDEDKLFNEAVKALKTADQLYPDDPSGRRGGGGGGRVVARSGGGGGGGGRAHADSNFASGGGGQRGGGWGVAARSGGGGGGRLTAKPLPRPPPTAKKARSFAPNLTEVFLILSGCTMLAAAGWIGFTFFRRKSYYDLRHGKRGGDEPDGIEVP